MLIAIISAAIVIVLPIAYGLCVASKGRPIPPPTTNPDIIDYYYED